MYVLHCMYGTTHHSVDDPRNRTNYLDQFRTFIEDILHRRVGVASLPTPRRSLHPQSGPSPSPQKTIVLINHARWLWWTADLLKGLQCSCKVASKQPSGDVTAPVDPPTNSSHPGLEPCDRRLRRFLPVWLRRGVHVDRRGGSGRWRSSGLSGDLHP